MTYEGWRNYETWAVKLWIGNDQSEQEYWHEQAQATLDDAGDMDSTKGMLTGDLKDYYENEAPELKGMYADLLNAALSEVAWHEIAESLLEDMSPAESAKDSEPND